MGRPIHVDHGAFRVKHRDVVGHQVLSPNYDRTFSVTGVHWRVAALNATVCENDIICVFIRVVVLVGLYNILVIIDIVETRIIGQIVVRIAVVRVAVVTAIVVLVIVVLAGIASLIGIC